MPAELLTPNSELPLSVCLTDSPEVVELKREFYRLCQEEERLRPFRHHSNAAREMAAISTRKAEIGREIFAAPAVAEGMI